MPLPWKKSKVSTISRVVPDLPSPKHRNSPVLQTGFPTSLVDLFWKNHDRLKKPYSKKKKHHNQNQNQNQQHVVAPDPANEVVIAYEVEEIQDQEAECSAADHEAHNSHKDRAKRKMMMKKLVAKTLRHRNKGKNVGVPQEDNYELQPEIVVNKFGDERRDQGRKLGRSGGEPFGHHRKGKTLLMLDMLTQQVLKEECDVGMQRHRKEKGLDSELSLLDGKLEAVVPIEERTRIDKKDNSSCLVIILAVLVGLAGGRILALLLTVASCLMLKLVVGRQKSGSNDKATKVAFTSFSK